MMIKLVTVIVCSVSVALSDEIDKRETYAPGQFFRILRQENDGFPDGRYRFLYETENGILAEEAGELRGTGEGAGTVAQGTYQYTSPEGIPIHIQYIADENGYHPSGNIIPGSSSRRL